MIDYTKLIKKIKDSIEAYPDYGFEYVERGLWFDTVDNFKTSQIGSSFTIILDEKGPNEDSISRKSLQLDITIEFALDARHDNYLKVFGHAESAIVNLKDVKYVDWDINQVEPYWTTEIQDNGILALTFDNIIFITK